ncbi:UNVERIFIED_CONTAM: hypothetical protein Slati_2268500 [Sesamum latifolium]|uniref:Transposase n=1 Tax=Sesamum latifolium TaxID=2727402 RepID=A0AAW2WVK6_9LAMI
MEFSLGLVILGHFTQLRKSYKQIPQSQKNFWFEELKRVYWWDYPDTLMQNIFNNYATSWLSKIFSETKVAGTQPNWLCDDIWRELQAYWDCNEFKAKSAKNKANRVANPTAASTVYRGGSSSVGIHKRKLEAQLGRPPNRMEVFAYCYKKKANDTWSGKWAEEVVISKLIRSCSRSVSLSPHRVSRTARTLGTLDAHSAAQPLNLADQQPSPTNAGLPQS